VGFAVVHKVCDAVSLGPAVAFVSELGGPADHSWKGIIVTWTMSGIVGESASGGRQESSTRVVVEAVDDLQRTKQAAYVGDASVRMQTDKDDTGVTRPRETQKASTVHLQASHVIALQSLSVLSALLYGGQSTAPSDPGHRYDILFLDTLVIPSSPG
jgi:hypothetical protein